MCIKVYIRFICFFIINEIRKEELNREYFKGVIIGYDRNKERFKYQLVSLNKERNQKHYFE